MARKFNQISVREDYNVCGRTTIHMLLLPTLSISAAVITIYMHRFINATMWPQPTGYRKGVKAGVWVHGVKIQFHHVNMLQFYYSILFLQVKIWQ